MDARLADDAASTAATRWTVRHQSGRHQSRCTAVGYASANVGSGADVSAGAMVMVTL